MKVYVIRHGKVDYAWSERSNSKEFDRECREYDTAPVEPFTNGLSGDAFQDLYISTLSRSRDSAAMLFPGRKAFKTRLADEVPLRSCFDTKKRFPLGFWDCAGRLQWKFNIARQPEGRRKTQKRAALFVAKICRRGADCAVVTHGFYMITLLQELKKAGFSIEDARVAYKNGEFAVAEKKGQGLQK